VAQLTIAAGWCYLWYVTRHPLQEGVRAGPRDTHEPAESSTSGCARSGEGGSTRGCRTQNTPPRTSSTTERLVQLAALGAQVSSAGRPKGGGGARGPAKRAHWEWGKGPEGAEFLGCWQCGYEFKILAH
jgi:hypothetical protein